MKKILVVLLTLIALTACSSKGYSSITNSDDVIFKGPDGQYTKAELYKSLKVVSEQPIVDDIVKKIATIEKVDFDQIDVEVEEEVQTVIDQGYEFYIQYYYGSIDTYKEIVKSAKLYEALKKNYAAEKYDETVVVDTPVKMQVAYFETEEECDNAIKDIGSGSTFDTAVLNNGFAGDPQVKVYLDSDDLPIQVKTYVKEAKETGLSNKIVTTTTSTDADGKEVITSRYYLVNIVDKDVNNYKDEYITIKVSDVEDATLINYLFSKYDVKFYDQDLYEIMSKAYEVLK